MFRAGVNYTLFGKTAPAFVSLMCLPFCRLGQGRLPLQSVGDFRVAVLCDGIAPED